jgi:hypothetical protein
MVQRVRVMADLADIEVQGLGAAVKRRNHVLVRMSVVRGQGRYLKILMEDKYAVK